MGTKECLKLSDVEIEKKSFIHRKCNLYEYENIVNINIR